MLFNSIVFIIFGGIFFLLLPLIRRLPNNFRWSFFVLASFVFYGWWNWLFLFLITGTGLIDFFGALATRKWSRYKLFFFILSLTGNVGSLIAFKYSGFFAENIEALFSQFGSKITLKTGIPEFLLILPVGISFYTFQSLSYTIEVYRGKLEPTKNVLHYFSYLSMFPQLLSGPIARAKNMLPQLMKVRVVSEAERWNGMKLIALGFFKKMVIADTLAPFVNEAFTGISPPHSSIYWWLVMFAFAFQIYFDFSGYTDIARGLAKWMGLHLKVNFNHPYISTSIKEFWTRWHISLSTWFRDYVFLPVAYWFSKKMPGYKYFWIRTDYLIYIFGVIITYLLCGFWHGASFTFIVWGLLHALYLIIERVTKWNKKIKKLPLGKIMAWFIVGREVVLAWVFFKSQNFSQASAVLKKMFSLHLNLNFSKDEVFMNALILLILCVIIEVLFFFNIRIKALFKPKAYRYVEIIYIALLVTFSIFFAGPGLQFIYFQF
jgi:alginate O-acetyltransferase complex protein AlgI